MISNGPPREGGPSACGDIDIDAAPAAQRVRLLVAYDGSGFRGFAENRDVPTVAASLRLALERILGTKVALTCSGRTDAGVHARGQVVSLDVPTATDLAALRTSLNSMVGPAVVVEAVEATADDFSARFSARWRRYRYQILNREVPDPFLARTSWWIDQELDVEAMEVAAESLVGEHDFSSFCRRPKSDPPASLVRRVLSADWSPDPAGGGLIRFEITATAFCHQMVRSIVGTLVEVGRGRRAADSLPSVLADRDRSRAGQLAPAHGLCLWEVGFDPPAALAAGSGRPVR